MFLPCLSEKILLVCTFFLGVGITKTFATISNKSSEQLLLLLFLFG